MIFRIHFSMEEQTMQLQSLITLSKWLRGIQLILYPVRMIIYPLLNYDSPEGLAILTFLITPNSMKIHIQILLQGMTTNAIQPTFQKLILIRWAMMKGH
jgi:hypothetical protein